jgi:beta-propeller repeat-containing protein
VTRSIPAFLGAISITLFYVLPQNAAALPPSAPTVQWVRQFGPGYQGTAVVASDLLGNVFVAGNTDPSLNGGPATGNTAYLRKYNSTGTPIWTQLAGPLEVNSFSVAVAADAVGNSYAAGETDSSIGGPNAGLTDYFLRKYDSTGASVWTQQGGSLSYDVPKDAAVDTLGNLYLVGYTGYELAGPGSWQGAYDAFLVKYDPLGNKLWSRQFGSPDIDIARGVALDGLGNVYIAGDTDGSLAAPFGGGSLDAFVAKYDQNGNAIWKRQINAPSREAARDIAADALGNVYVAGFTDGSPGGPNAGAEDIVVYHYDAAGNLTWTRQTGTSEQDISFGAATDGLGNVYLSGVTGGNLFGTSAGAYDAVALKYRSNGTLDWGYQVGSSADEFGGNIASDGFGNVYLSGVTQGNIAGPVTGGEDSFVVKLYDTTLVPEPATAAQLCLLALSAFCRPRRRRRAN